MTDMPPRPTESELDILAILWERGPSTVHEVHASLRRDTGYTTVLKFMQVMTDKGLLRREKRGRQHVYRPASEAEQMQKSLVKDFVGRAFGGSFKRLLVSALSANRVSQDELNEIRKLIDQAQARQRKGGES